MATGLHQAEPSAVGAAEGAAPVLRCAVSPFLGAEGFSRKALRWAMLPSSCHVGASRALRVVRGWF